MEDKRILEAIADGILVIDKDYKIVFANQAALDLCQLSSDEVIGHNCHMLHHRCPSPCKLPDLCPHSEVFSTGKPVSVKHTHFCPDGKEQVFSITASPIRDENGNVVQMVEMLKDITKESIAEKMKQEADEQIRILGNLVDLAPAAIMIHDLEGNVIFVNQTACDLHGYTREEYLALNLRDLAVPESAALIESMMRQQSGTGMTTFEIAHFRKDRTKLPIRVMASMAEWGGKKVLFCFGTDITERKAAEQALIKAQAEWFYATNFIDDAIFLVDLNDKVVHANNAFYTMTGLIPDKVIGGDLTLLMHPQGEPVPCPICAARRNRQDADVSMEPDHPNNPIKRPIQVMVRIIRDQSGSPVGVLQAIRDLTAQEKLRQSEAFIKSVLESVGDGFVVIDHEYRIISANKAYCEQHKTKLEDIIGKYCYEISHHIANPCFTAGEVCAPMHTFKTGEPSLSVHTHYDAVNNPTYIETRSFSMKDASGRITAVIEILNNVTDRKKLEDQLRQAQKMEAVGVLAGGVAHDFNNILTGIIGYAHISLMKMNPDDPVRYNVDQILACSERAAALTQSLLSFSRKQVINPVLLDLNELLPRFEKFIRRLIPEDIDLMCHCGAGALTVMADSGQIEQAIMNLVTNARDAMPGGGRLMIETGQVRLDKDFIDAHGYGIPGEFALISITDTGMGMDEATKTHIFEPFFTTKEQGKGTGLGLSMVYGIVKKHDGFVTVYTEPGKGTTFKIYLPVEEVNAAPEKAHAEEPVQSLEGTETVLLAEDDEVVRRLTRTVLENVGYTVIEAVDGEDAVHQFVANKDRIQLAILDVIMPKKNGGQVFREMKAINPGFPVLFVSGYPAEIAGKQGILEPGIKFAAKPISPTDLLKKVREALGK